MRFEKWGGLLTYASPYSVPPGAAVTQINLTCSYMGQLTVRDGMQPLRFSNGSVSQCVDVSAYSYQGLSKLLVLDETGQLQVLDAVDRDSPLGEPYLPSLPYAGDEIHVGYDYRWNEGGEAVVDGTLYYAAIWGGRAGTRSWPATADANAPYCGDGKIQVFAGGRAQSTYTPTIQYVDICQ